MATRTRQVRRGPGETVCPSCKGLTNNSDLVEIIRSDKRKGKVVCTSCGIQYLRTVNGDLKTHKGPVQIPDQQTLI